MQAILASLTTGEVMSGQARKVAIVTGGSQGIGAGHVVSITTTLADYANSSVPSVLTALTKGGLASATRSLAIEYASRGAV
jgi:NAD(P)-dependent dehydrogenase (short-subunit alcohol dehydrogenase family)